MRCHHRYDTQILPSKTRKQLTTENTKTTAKTEPVTIPTTSSLPLSRPCVPDEEFPLDGNELFHWSSTHQHGIYLLSLPQRCGTGTAELAQRQQCNFLSGAHWWRTKKYVRHWLGPVLWVSFSALTLIVGWQEGQPAYKNNLHHLPPKIYFQTKQEPANPGSPEKWPLKCRMMMITVQRRSEGGVDRTRRHLLGGRQIGENCNLITAILHW